MSSLTEDMVEQEAKDDAALVTATLAGERRAFDALVGRHQQQAVAVAYRTLGNLHDAMEVVQDAFLKAYRALDSLENAAAFRSWLLRIVANLALNYRRSRSRRQTRSLDECVLASGDAPADVRALSAGRDDHPEDRANAAELERVIQAALLELPEKTRMALVLFGIEKLPQKEVASILGISVEATKWHVFSGRKKMKELLAAYL